MQEGREARKCDFQKNGSFDNEYFKWEKDIKKGRESGGMGRRRKMSGMTFQEPETLRGKF